MPPLTCTTCGQANDEDARFCIACGEPLADRSVAPRQARTMVTVLFSDVTGFTAISERVDPEALRDVMERYFEAMRAVIERHRGRVEKFIGDAVVAVFGLPVVREDDALRAVRAAAEIGGALNEVNTMIPPGLAVELTASTGVNTGEVSAGEDPSATQAGEVIGDTVNAAARLESAAGPGEVLLGELTFRLTHNSVQAERVESALEEKGADVAAFRLIELISSIGSDA